jgi:hypothetical protein
MRGRGQSILLVVTWLGLQGVVTCHGDGAEPVSSKESSGTRTNEVVQLIELRGRVICLPEEMQRRHQAELPTRHEHIWGFKATNGVCYTLLRGRFSEAIWLDDRIRAKELQLRARLFPRTQILELQNVKSVRDGVVQDLYYFCDVCSIQSVSPEVCACCQGPVVLVEKPLKAKEE